jgi:tetratricopeptide (TPR) repeat protein
MVLPLGVVLGMRARGLARAAFIATGVLCVLVIAASLSRAAWAALGVALGVLGLGALRLGQRRTVLSWGVGLAAGLGLLVGLSLVLPQGAELSALVSERTRALTDPGARHFIWRAAWNIFLEHPLLGCGLDGFALAFQRHREPAYWLLEWATTPYRAHSDLLHVLATQGLVGAGAVAVLMVGLGRAGLAAWRQARREDQPLVLAILAGLAAFCVQGLVGFTVTATAVLFFTFAGVLSCLCEQGSEERGFESVTPALWSSAVLSLSVFAFNFLGGPWDPDPARPGPAIALLVLLCSVAGMMAGVSSAALPPSGSGAAAPVSPARRTWVRVAAWGACLGGVYLLVLQPYRANLAAHEGDLLLSSEPEQAVALYSRATALDPTRDFYFVRLGTALQQTASRTADPAERTQRLSRALESFQRAVSLVPADARHRADLGSMLAEFAALKMAAPSQVYATFDEALERDPYDATFHVRAANAALRLGDAPMAQRYASRAAELYPHFGPPRAQLGYLALTAGRTEEAARLLSEALEGDWYDDTAAEVAASGNLAVALLAQGHTEQAVTEYRRLLALQPDYLPALEALHKLGADAGHP